MGICQTTGNFVLHRLEPEGGCADEVLGERKKAERKALLKVFNETRKLSASSKLMTSQYWEEAGCIPDHMSPTDFEMLIYTFLVDYSAKRRAEHSEYATSVVYRSAPTTIIAPQSIQAEAGASIGCISVGVPLNEAVETSAPLLPACCIEAASSNGASRASGLPSGCTLAGCALTRCVPANTTFEPDSADEIPCARAVMYAPLVDTVHPAISCEEANLPSNFPLPEGFGLALVDGMPMLIPREKIDVNASTINCDDIVMLLGYSCFYLYSQTRMSDQDAQRAYFAFEDARMAAFASSIREETRKHLRPTVQQGFEGEAFRLASDEMGELWEAVEESGAYPDLKKIVVSNGDVYYYSDNYLDPPYAETLVEWNAVERSI